MEKSLKVKVLFINYVDLESLLEKISTCHNNLEKSSTPKIKEHTPSGYSLFIHCSFDTTKNKTDYYRGKNCMQNFCLDLRQHATKIINYERKRNDTITKWGKKTHLRQIKCHMLKKI